MDKCCGNCKYNHCHYGTDLGSVCMNDESECLFDWMDFEDSCEEWEGRE